MATEDLTFRFNVTGNAVPQFQAVQKQVRAVDNQVKRTTATVRAHANQYDRTAVATNKWAKGALQQAGFQIGDYAVQVANGTSKMQAFGQQGAQLLGIFGPVGAVLGAAVAIFSAVGVAAEKSGQEISNMGAALGVLQEPLTSVVNSVKALGSAFGGVFPVIVQNIDTALIAAGLFAAVVGVKMVGGMIASAGAGTILTGAMVQVRAAILASAISSGKFNLALVALRSTAMLTVAAFSALSKIMMRFLPVAVLVGLAKLIEIFMRLVKGAGSFGNALGLLKDLAVEVFARMGNAGLGFKNLIVGVAYDMAANWKWALMQMGKGIQALFGDSAQALKNIPGLEGMALRLNNVAISAGSNVHNAATEMENFEDKANSAYSSAAEAIREGTKPLESWQAIKDAVKAGTEEVKIFGDASVEANEKTGGSASEAAKQIEDAQKKIQSLADSISKSFGDAFMSVVEGTKSAKDAFRDMARAIIKELFQIFVVKRITGFISNAIGNLFGPGMTTGTPLQVPSGSGASLLPPSFSGGGYTGNRARAGGLDGKGGFMAMMHPRETVVDHTKGQSAGGVVVNQTINVSTGVQQTVRTEIKSLMPQIAESAKSAVVDAKRRGGSYGRAFT